MEDSVYYGSLILIGMAAVVILADAGNQSSFPELRANIVQDTPKQAEEISKGETKKATFAGGCFWCVEAAYENKNDVEAAISGYAGGTAKNAEYAKVSTGETDHREAVRIRYYPSKVNYSELLDIYWKTIDPTDPGGQFSDRGFQYTTAIYYHNERQKQLALDSRRSLNQSDRFSEPVVTEIKNLTTFFRAEDRHQNYSKKRALSYRVYEKASGRKGFLEKKWSEPYG